MQDDHAEMIGTFKMMLTHPLGIFLNMNFVTKAGTVVALVCLLIGVGLAIQRRNSGAERSSFLAALGIIGLVAGGLGALYDAFVTWETAQMLQETRLVVMLPSIIEAVFALLVGVLAWAIAAIGNAGAKR